MKILPAEAIRFSSATAVQPLAPAPRREGAAGPPAGASFREVLGRRGGRIDEGEKAMDRAARGGASLGPGDLLALQARVYRHVEAVDLATKLVDRATSAVKTTLQGQ